MNTGDAGIALIKEFEQCRLKAFKPTRDDVWTIGWGRTAGVKMGDTCTQEEADAWFLEDLATFEGAVNAAVTVPLTQNEFDALVSFAYNVGEGAFRKSTLLKLLNDSDYDGAARQLLRWNKQAGNELAGLSRRRKREMELFELA